MCIHKWVEESNSMRIYIACINPNKCNKKAHNGITYIEYCKFCGAERKVNKKGNEKEYFELNSF